MVLSGQGVNNLTNVVLNSTFSEQVAVVTEGYNWALVTSNGWFDRGILNLITNNNKPKVVVHNIPQNPTIDFLFSIAKDIPNVDLFLAVGGGSVIDSAKFLSAYLAVGKNKLILKNHILKNHFIPPHCTFGKLIAVPTTSGSGSEVTRTATIWGMDKSKHSLSDARLFPSIAILDPSLCCSLPWEETLASALDALSHGMEAIWSKNHTLHTDLLAQSAIKTIFNNLGLVLSDPTNVLLRGKLQIAAMEAGLAISQTQTAIAHSISYPFTAYFGLPHGFASSFTLPEIVLFNKDNATDRFDLISSALGVPSIQISDTLYEWFNELGLNFALSKYIDINSADNFGENLIEPSRTINNIREIKSYIELQTIAKNSLERLLG